MQNIIYFFSSINAIFNIFYLMQIMQILIEIIVEPVNNALLVQMSQSENDFARIESERLSCKKVFYKKS